jgi:hypothetical protein
MINNTCAAWLETNEIWAAPSVTAGGNGLTDSLVTLRPYHARGWSLGEVAGCDCRIKKPPLETACDA